MSSRYKTIGFHRTEGMCTFVLRKKLFIERVTIDKSMCKCFISPFTFLIAVLQLQTGVALNDKMVKCGLSNVASVLSLVTVALGILSYIMVELAKIILGLDLLLLMGPSSASSTKVRYLFLRTCTQSANLLISFYSMGLLIVEKRICSFREEHKSFYTFLLYGAFNCRQTFLLISRRFQLSLYFSRMLYDA